MEPEGSLPYSQLPATCPYPEPTPSSPHNPLQFPEVPHRRILIRRFALFWCKKFTSEVRPSILDSPCVLKQFRSLFPTLILAKSRQQCSEFSDEIEVPVPHWIPFPFVSPTIAPRNLKEKVSSDVWTNTLIKGVGRHFSFLMMLYLLQKKIRCTL
jgi:hypothetical protein